MPYLPSALDIFRKKERNFMTPNVLQYFESGLYAIELSEGRDIHNRLPIFGVSVMRRDLDIQDKATQSKARLFYSQKDAEIYIDALLVEGREWWKMIEVTKI